MSEFATIRLADMVIPLIGIPKCATEEKCDVCGKTLHFQAIELRGEIFICVGCRIRENFL